LEYAFSLTVNDGTPGQSWFDLAHSTGNPYSGGGAFNSDNSNAATVGNGTQSVFGTYAAMNPGNYSYVFAAEGVVATPEPTSLALLGLGGLGLIAANRRRRA
jgi:hypothetical protein